MNIIYIYIYNVLYILFYYVPFCCHPAQYSCSQSIVCRWDRQTPPIYVLVCQLMQTPEMCWPQSHQSTNNDEKQKSEKIKRKKRATCCLSFT